MGANLLPCNAAVRLQARTSARGSLEERRSDHGKGNRVLHTEHLPKKGDLDPPRTTRESNRVSPTDKEVGISCQLLCSRRSVSLLSVHKIAVIAVLALFLSQLRQPPYAIVEVPSLGRDRSQHQRPFRSVPPSEDRTTVQTEDRTTVQTEDRTTVQTCNLRRGRFENAQGSKGLPPVFAAA
jgi:hypothetical protein